MTIRSVDRGCCVRENEISNARYLQRNGTWGEYRTRARYYSQRAAEKAAERAGIEVYGIFP